MHYTIEAVQKCNHFYNHIFSLKWKYCLSPVSRAFEGRFREFIEFLDSFAFVHFRYLIEA